MRVFFFSKMHWQVHAETDVFTERMQCHIDLIHHTHLTLIQRVISRVISFEVPLIIIHTRNAIHQTNQYQLRTHHGILKYLNPFFCTRLLRSCTALDTLIVCLLLRSCTVLETLRACLLVVLLLLPS